MIDLDPDGFVWDRETVIHAELGWGVFQRQVGERGKAPGPQARHRPPRQDRATSRN